MSAAVKRSALVMGERYVVMERHGGFGPRRTQQGGDVLGCPATVGYRRVELVELRSGNRAVVRYDDKTFSHGVGHPDRKVIDNVRLVDISCSTILASVDDWDRNGHHFDAKAKHCVLNDPAPADDNLVGQDQIGEAA